MKLSTADLKDLEKKGISTQQIDAQIDLFRKGFPFLKVKESASTCRGILAIDEHELNQYIDIWDKFTKNKSKYIYKFVPASGAATRMFKDLFTYIETTEQTEYIDFFKKNIDKFAFYNDLNRLCIQHYSKSPIELINDGRINQVIHLLLDKEGLNYANLPKGLIKFHSYPNYARTAVEEHLVEGSEYAITNNQVDLHFTISPEHRQLFITLIEEKTTLYSDKYKVNYKVSFSAQDTQTDTIAVDIENNPIRDEDGKLIFRPAGHGALLQNLNKIDADVIFIKNIDNVVPDKYKALETKYKKALAGYLVSVQAKIYHFLEILDSGQTNRTKLDEILHFVQNILFIHKEQLHDCDDEHLVNYLKEKLNRPIRVCGMVKNVGEAGGGPFFVTNKDNSVSLQILESSQIDKNNLQYIKIQEGSSHFNPVDIVCGVKDYKGKKFNLENYVDKDTGFISNKSYKGKTLRALELPGLWNGSMSDWNTIFIEVPLDTFNPVKNVNDLLREHHQ